MERRKQMEQSTTPEAPQAALEVQRAWDFVVEHERELRRMCESVCRYRPDLVEDLYSAVVIDRAVMVYRTYNPEHESGAPLKTHMLINLRFYAYKWLATLGRPRAARFDVQLPDEYDAAHDERNELALSGWVEDMVGRLDPYYQRIL